MRLSIAFNATVGALKQSLSSAGGRRQTRTQLFDARALDEHTQLHDVGVMDGAVRSVTCKNGQQAVDGKHGTAEMQHE